MPKANKNTTKQQEVLNTVAALNQFREHTKNLLRIHKKEHGCHGKCDLAKGARGVIKDVNADIHQIGVESGIIA